MNTDNLKRTIGLVSATSIGLGAMLGAGIFVFPGIAGGQAGFAAVFSFLIGGVIALLVALCTAELATAMPQSGGGYFFISRSFGPFWGTLTGIAQWIGLIFACAFYLVSFGEYALSFMEELNVSWPANTKVYSFFFTAVLLLLNIVGTKKVGRFQNLMVISLTIMLSLIFTYGLIDYLGFEEKSVAISAIHKQDIPSIFSTTALIFTAYLGFVQIANIGAEIKQPTKNLPRSLIGSVIIAMSIYVFIMIVCSITFPQEELKKFGETATIEVARKLIGNWGGIIVLFAGLLAALSSANASMISASRGVFAVSKDELISKKASQINDSFGTPHIALILVTLPVAIMLIKGKLEVFAEVASFLHLVIYAGICLSVLKLRAQAPSWYLPTFRVPAIKFVAVIGALSCLILVCFMQKASIIISLIVLLAAAAYYVFYVRRKEIKITNPTPPHLDVNLLHPNILIPVDITKEKKDLPHAILNAIPISNVLLLGFKETPEQSEAEQSEEKFEKEGEEKLASILDHLEEAKFDFDSKLIFGNKITDQIEKVIEEEKLQFILTLKPLCDLHRLVIPIFNVAQINKKLSTIIYKLNSFKPSQIKVLLFTESEDDSTNERQLRQAIENQLGLVNIKVDDYVVHPKEEESPEELIAKASKEEDLIIWTEQDKSQRDVFLNIILERNSVQISSPIIMILK